MISTPHRIQSNNELVSVIITTYSRPTLLKRSIESVLSQSHTNFELIVVDDNSDVALKKKVSEIVNSFDDNRIRLISNKINLGGALSRNVGIEAAKSEFIAFLDDDDEYLPTKIEEQLDVFKNPHFENLGLVYCYCYSVDRNRKRLYYKNNAVGNCLFEGMIDCIAATSQWMCSKKALLSVGMFTDVPCKQDFLVIIKLLAAGFSVDRVPKVLSVYHDESCNRISGGNHLKRIVGEEAAWEYCKKHYSKLTAREIKQIDFSFACRLAEHYFAVDDYDNYYKCRSLITSKLLNKKSLTALYHIRLLKKEKRK